MTPLEVLRQQEELAPKGDLSRYEGQWVALRRGRVVEGAPDPQTLLASGNVLASDAIMHVVTRHGHLIV